MSKDHTKIRLQEAGQAINVAVQILRPHIDLFREYEREAQRMESAGPVLAPSLYLDSERRAVDALMGPLFRQADQFVTLFDEKVSAAKSALEKVKA